MGANDCVLDFQGGIDVNVTYKGIREKSHIYLYNWWLGSMTFPFGAISAYFGWGIVSFREGRWNTFPRKREEMSMLKEVAPDMYPTFLCSQYLNEKLKTWLIAGASKYSNIAPMTTAFCLNTLSRVMRTSIPHNKLMITVVMWRDPGSFSNHIIKSYTTSLENTTRPYPNSKYRALFEGEFQDDSTLPSWTHPHHRTLVSSSHQFCSKNIN